MIEQPLLSIVITSYTNVRIYDIYELLDSIKLQTYSHIETIFVTEQSRELYDQVQSYAQEKAIPNFNLIFNDGERGASSARNLGIREAKGEIIAFLDDDVLPFANWAEEMVKTYTDVSIIGVTGPAFPLWEDKSAATWFPEEFYWLFSCTAWNDWQQITEVRNIWTMNASFRREAFLAGGYFITAIGPKSGSMSGRKNELSEDLEISLRIRNATARKIVFNPAVKVQHRIYNERLKMDYITRWSYWIGLSKQKLKNNYQKTSIDVLSQEHQLLKRIFKRLIPNILQTFFTHPVIALRRLKITLTVLIFVAFGYYITFFRLLLTGNKQRIQKSNKEFNHVK